MEKIYIGKIVSTHGIKGELKVLSDFPYKEKVFFVGNKVLIDDKVYEIKSYRIHKKFDMITLDNYKDINEVLFLLKKDLYVKRENLKLLDNEILDEELLTYDVLKENREKGKILEIFNAGESNKIIRVLFQKEVLIPLNSPIIKKIDKNTKSIYVELIDGME